MDFLVQFNLNSRVEIPIPVPDAAQFDLFPTYPKFRIIFLF